MIISSFNTNANAIFATNANFATFPGVIPLVELVLKMEKKALPPPSSDASRVEDKRKHKDRKITKAGPVSTSTKQITGYTTINGIYSETKVREPQYPEFAVKELMENAYDYLQISYPVKAGNTKETRKIAIRIKIEPIPSVTTQSSDVITDIIRIVVRNSNVDNKTVFENLEEVFNYDNWFSSKRNQFRGTTGALGDFLKRSLGMGYASWTADFNPDDTLEERQWDEPIIFRFNGQERRVTIEVEPGRKVLPHFVEPIEYDTSGFTEVEIAMPISVEWKRAIYGYNSLTKRLANYCKIARLSKIKTDLSFLVDGKVE
jgi:hypothetical protein